MRILRGIPFSLALLAGCGGDSSSGLLSSRDLQAVVELQTARDGGALARLLADRSPAVRARAALALGSVQDQTAAPALIEALGDEDPLVRAHAAFALGRMLARGTHSPAGLAALAERLTDPRPEVRRDAAWGFGQAFQPGLWQAQRPAVLAALDGYDKAEPAANGLLRGLG